MLHFDSVDINYNFWVRSLINSRFLLCSSKLSVQGLVSGTENAEHSYYFTDIRLKDCYVEIKKKKNE